jgi:hypothetical protein
MYQTGLKHLLYDLNHPNRWFLGTLEQVKARVSVILDQCGDEWRGVQAGFALVCAGKERESQANEQLVSIWGRWLMTEGAAHGLRPPSGPERARAVGMHEYLEALGLHGRALYDAVGTHFDPRCLQIRVASLLTRWMRDGQASQPDYASPQDLATIFARVHAAARRNKPFAILMRSPFRTDVEAQLIHNGALAGPISAMLAHP